MKNSFPYIAHISEDGQREQSVLAHLEGTAKLSAQFASFFDAESMGEFVGMAHDIGKYSAEFQRRIRGENISVDHSTAGAYECALRNQPLAALAVAGHHGELPDLGSRIDTADEPTLQGRFKRVQKGRVPNYSAFQSEVSLPQAQIPAHLNRKSNLEAAFFTRMLYSCLVDADFLDTEAFMRNEERSEASAPMETLIQRLEAYKKDWENPEPGSLNEKRSDILAQCIAAGKAEAPGLFTLTVPTGGGKTTSSLAFALHHARASGFRRVIYVIPYTSIIEQNAEVFRKILGDEYVLEHHSGVNYDIRDTATPQELRKAQAVENWDMPVVVTTAVQFFESLFSSRSGKCRKLHNIAGSVVIFDEAQTIPLPYLRPCVHAISQLVKSYRVSAVLCTATQPALENIFDEFLPNAPAREICPGLDFNLFKRVTFRHAGQLKNAEVAERLGALSQALCIVNSRKRANELYALLDPDGAFHLSTLMTPEHRKTVIELIKKRLKEGLPCRVISTSLIEAGVDISFPAVYREEAGLDSIMQAAGRCNREGKHSPEESIVTIFKGEDPAPALFQAAIGAANRTLKAYGSPDAPGAIHAYFSELLDLYRENKKAPDKILAPLAELRFREASEKFRLIEENTRTIYIPLPESEELLELLRAGKPLDDERMREESMALVEQLTHGEKDRALFRRLGLHSVSVYEQHFRALYDAHDIELIDGEYGVLINPKLYTLETGLSLKADSGKAEII